MYKEKSMYDFVPAARTIETKTFLMPIKLESGGYGHIVCKHEVITGWEPMGRELPNGKN
jgi:hypothetical protein